MKAFMTTIKNFSAIFLTFFSLILFNPQAQAATQAYIPDSALGLGFSCENGVGKAPVVCTKQFTIKDTIWSVGVFGCNHIDGNRCIDPYYPIETWGSHSYYSTDPISAIQDDFKGTQLNYAIEQPNHVITGMTDCRYDAYNYYSCQLVGYDITYNSNDSTTSNVPFVGTRIGVGIYRSATTCPNNGVYVNGKGCTTNQYTDNNGNTYKTDRTIIGTDICVPCLLAQISQITDILPPVNLSQMYRGDPISINSKSVVEAKTDFNFPIPFNRSYSSNRTVASSLGLGWRHNFDKKLVINNDTDSTGAFANLLTFQQESDDELVFSRNSRGDSFAVLYADQKGLSVTVNTTNYVLNLPNGGTETYNLNGNLTQIIYTNGTTYTFTRDSQDNLTKITNSEGQYLNITINNNLITQVTASTGDTIVYNYSNGQLTSAVLNNLPSISYTYDTNHKLTNITDELNNPYAAFLYNSKGEAIQNARILNGNKIEQHDFTYNDNYITETQPNGNYVSYILSNPFYKNKITSFKEDNRQYSITYDNNGNILYYYNYRNGNYTYTYDNNNLVTSITRPDRTTVSTTWDTNLRLPLTVTEPYAGGSRVISFTYDQYRNVASRTIATNEGSRVWNYTYAPGGKMLLQTNPNGTSTTYTYYDNTTPLNIRGLLKTVKNALNQTITINSYDLRGNPTSVTGIDGVTKTMTYDIHSNVLTETIGQATNTYTYNASSDLLTASLATGYQLTMTYDLAHRLVAISDNNGGSSSFVLDDTTSVATSENILQNNVLVTTRNKIIDDLGRITSVSHANSTNATSYTYNGDDSLYKVTDANNIASYTNMDDMGRVVSTSSPSYQSSNVIDTDGNITETNINYYQKTTTVYNGFKELTQMVSLDTGTHTYTNDLANRITTHTDNAGTVHSTTYDLAGRPTTITHTNTTGTSTENIHYHSKGSVSYIQDSSGVTSYYYDLLNRLTKKTQNINGRSFNILYGYNNANQLSTETYPSGLVVHYNYTNGLLTSITTTGAASTTVVDNISYQSMKNLPVSWNLANNPVTATYDSEEKISGFTDNTMNQIITTDNVGNIASINDSTNNYSLTAGYTNAYQLTSGSINNQTLDYRYESNLNIFLKRDNGNGPQFTYKQFTNQMTGYYGPTNNATILSDSNGNVTTDQNGSYTYDLKNNMVSSNLTVAATSGSYNFNALNQRVSKTVNSVKTYFVYNERQQLIGEYDQLGNVISEHIYLSLRPVSLYQNNQMYAVHTDYLGTPRIITDSGNTTVWKWLNIDSFGANLPDTQTINYNLRFAGQYFDNESKLHYNYYRTYNPQTGRYMQSDPLGLAAGANTYNYVGNNPLNAVDPLGLKPVTADSCHALLDLIEYERYKMRNDPYGPNTASRKFYESPFMDRYSLGSGFLTHNDILALNASFETTIGKVDADWMMRSGNPILGSSGYFVGKRVWNIINKVFTSIENINRTVKKPIPSLDAGMQEEGHKNAPNAAKYYWEHDTTLEKMFAPAISDCLCKRDLQ